MSSITRTHCDICHLSCEGETRDYDVQRLPPGWILAKVIEWEHDQYSIVRYHFCPEHRPDGI